MKYFALTLAIFVSAGAASAFDDSVNTLYDLDKNFSQYSASHGFQAAFAKYTSPDAIKLQGQNHPLIGRSSVLASLPPFSETLTITWLPYGGDISASKDLGYTWGIYTVEQTDEEGSVNHSYGKYMTIWKKSADGKWQVVLDGGNSSPGVWPEINSN